MKHQKTVNRLPLQIFAVIISILIVGQFTGVQSQQGPTKSADRGFSPGKSYSISDIENISMQSGNLMLSVPLGSLPAGRGGITGGFSVHYNSKLWDMATVAVEGQLPEDNYITNGLLKSGEGGWRYGYKYYLKIDYAPMLSCLSSEGAYQHKIQMVMPDGGQHSMVVQQGGITDADDYSNIYPDGRAACNGSAINGGQTIVFYSHDGTFLRLEVTTDSDTNWQNNTWTLYLRDGTKVVNNLVENQQLIADQRVIDRNGNYIDIIEKASDSTYSNRTTTSMQDQFGRKVVIEYDAVTNQDGTSEDYIHSLGYNGTSLFTRVKWKDIIVNRTYDACVSGSCPPQVENFSLYETLRVIDRIYLPAPTAYPAEFGGLFYEFQYNADSTSTADTGWGEVSQVQLPSGAKSAYLYKCNNSCVTTEAVLSNRPTEKTLSYYPEYDGQTGSLISDVWTYQTTGSDPNLPTSSKIIAPDGGETTEYYSPLETVPPSPTPPAFLPHEVYKTTMPDGTVIQKWYESNAPAASYYKGNRFVKYEFITVKDAGNQTKTSAKKYSYDKNGNITEVKEYDWITCDAILTDTPGRPNGLPSCAVPSRITKTAYHNAAPAADSTSYSDQNIYRYTTAPRLQNLAQSIEIQDGTETPKSRSEFVYDDTTYTTNTIAGNLEQTFTWDSTKASSLPSQSSNGYKLDTTNSISTSTDYNSYGMPTETTDANGVKTTITYGNISGPNGTITNLYPTQTETASNYSSLKRTSTAAYDFYTGLVTTSADADNNVLTETTYDKLGRPIKVETSGSGTGTALELWTQTVYDDTGRKVIVKSDLDTVGDAKKVAVQHYDQLGRVRLTRTIENIATEDPTNEQHGVKVQTRYKTSGGYNYQIVSNPYRATASTGASSEPSMGWTRSKTKSDGKESETETFSGHSLPAPWGSNTSSTGVVKSEIDADRTLVTDQAGKQRISRTNALGQLKDVWEITASDSATESVSFPTETLSAGYKTSYAYDTLNNLITVTQGAQTRSFSYSSLSRLLSAINPESGTISYQYDNNGNLTNKTDARPITTTYSYDALNRVTARNYSDSTPDVVYTYDNVANAKGKLTKVSSDASETRYTAFDVLGRVTAGEQLTTPEQRTGSQPAYAMAYKYNLSGALVEQTYPSGRVVKNVLDNDGELALVQSKKTANHGYFNYASSFTYTAAGAVSSMQLGNGRWESTVFNSRLQPTQIALGATQNATNLLNLVYTYNTTGNADNNGNVLSQTISVPTVGTNTGFTAAQTYTYDSLNRLKSATENLTPTGGTSTQTWKQTFNYDRYGNRTFDETVVGGNPLTTTLTRNCSTSTYNQYGICDKKKFNPNIAATDNRIVEDQDTDSSMDYEFDEAGNTEKDADGKTFTYDAENKQILVMNGTLKVGEYFYDGDGKRVKKIAYDQYGVAEETTIFVYDASGKMVAEYSTQVAQPSEAKVSYLTSDHLGSPRILTEANGNVINRRDFHPFGEEIGVNTPPTAGRNAHTEYGGDNVPQKFTSYERDNESGLDFAQARYYGNSLGRFTSPDPLYIEFRRLPFPQAWNLYVYTRNNPLIFIDPDGLEVAVNCKTTKEQVKACQEQTTTDLNNRKDGEFKVEIKNGKLAIVGKVDASKLSKSERKLYNAITDTFGRATLNVEMSSDKITFGRADAAGQNSIDLSDLSKLNASGNKTLSGEVIAHEAIEGYESSLDTMDEEDAGLSYQQTGQFRRSHTTANQFFGDVTITLADVSGLSGARVSSRDATYNFGRIGSVTVTKKFKTPVPLASITSFENAVGDIDKVVAPNSPAQTPVKPK